MTRILLAACSALALGACASADQSAATPSDRDCFNSDNVSGYSIVDDHHVKLTVGASREYVLGLDWNARDLDWTEVIAIRSTTGWICTGNGLGVSVRGGRPVRTYYVDSIERAPEPPPEAAPQGS